MYSLCLHVTIPPCLHLLAFFAGLLRYQPMGFYPKHIVAADARSISELSRLKHGQRVKVGGLIVTLQRPPMANGYTFLALEDPTGLVNVVIALRVYAQYPEAIHSTPVIVDGVVQKDYGAINVVAAQVTST